MAFDWDEWNVSVNADRVALARISYYNVSAFFEGVLSIGSVSFVDEDNDVYYENTMVEVPTLTVGSSGVDGGAVGIGIGDLVVSNIDGRYEEHFDDSFVGREIEILLGPRNNGIADFRSVFIGVVGSVKFDADRTITFQARDNLQKLNRPVQTNRITGTNLPDGAEEQVRPLCYGNCFSVPPILVNAGFWIFQTTDSNVQDAALSVRTDGVGINSTVSATTNSTGKFTLDTEPVGTITVDVEGAKPGGAYLQDMGDVLEDILVREDEDGDSILSSSEINAASLTALNTDSGLEAAIWMGEKDLNVLDALEMLMPRGYLYGFNRAGEFFAKHLLDPDGEVSSQTLGTSDIVRNGFNILEADRPAFKVICLSNKNYLKITDFRAGSTRNNRSQMSKDFRSRHKTKNVGIKTLHKDAREITVELMASSGGQSESSRLFDLYSEKRRVYEVDCWAKPLSFEIGDIVEVTYPRYGFESGVNLVFIGSDNQLDKSRVTAYFWG